MGANELNQLGNLESPWEAGSVALWVKTGYFLVSCREN